MELKKPAKILIFFGIILITAAISVVITIIARPINRPNTDNPINEEKPAQTTRETTGETTVHPELKYQTALREYCQTPDSVYSYKLLSEFTYEGLSDNSTTYILNMTSQAWETPELVGNGHIWWHYMSITIPDVIHYEDAALVDITDGSNQDDPPNPRDNRPVIAAIQLAERIGMVTATIHQVPNQPILFPDDTKQMQRYEDDIVAYTWRRFITEIPEDPYYLLRMPMTKATVRAMDTVTHFANSKINRFYLTGVSKRGWTAWSTAAVDDRVVGIAPQVFDILNFKENLQHHFRSLKGWTFALAPYFNENITLLYDHPNFPLMATVSDPFSYRDILTMPKYVITAGNDEFFLPDNSHYFYDQMKGPTYLRIHPNVGHLLTPRLTYIIAELTGFIVSVEENWQFPQLTWTRGENETHGEITMSITGQTPVAVKAHRAFSANDYMRDFRMHYLNYTTGRIASQQSHVLYHEINVIEKGNNVYQSIAEKPATGWVCFFIEVEFQASRDQTIRFTSEVNIIPDVYPIGPCAGEGCYGRIV